MAATTEELVVEELRTIRAELAALRQALERPAPWNEQRRAAFVASLEEAAADGEKNGFLSIEEVDTMLEAEIEAAERERQAG